MNNEILNQEGFAARDLRGIDRWESFSPIRSGWTDVGSPAVSGRWQQRGALVLFQVEISPGTSCATTAGTSYIVLPKPAAGYGTGQMTNQTTNIVVGGVAIDKANSRAYVPSQTATGDLLVVTGWFEV